MNKIKDSKQFFAIYKGKKIRDENWDEDAYVIPKYYDEETKVIFGVDDDNDVFTFSVESTSSGNVDDTFGLNSWELFKEDTRFKVESLDEGFKLDDDCIHVGCKTISREDVKIIVKNLTKWLKEKK